jgi:hypothetical protein
MPQQLGAGVKFAAELMIMGLCMTLHKNHEFILFVIDFKNA